MSVCDGAQGSLLKWQACVCLSTNPETISEVPTYLSFYRRHRDSGSKVTYHEGRPHKDQGELDQGGKRGALRIATVRCYVNVFARGRVQACVIAQFRVLPGLVISSEGLAYLSL